MYVKAGIKNLCNQSQYFLSIPPNLQAANGSQTSITCLFLPRHPFYIQVHFILQHRTSTFIYMFCASAWSQGIACMYVHHWHWHTAHSPTVWLLSSGSSAVSLFEYLSVCLFSVHSTVFIPFDACYDVQCYTLYVTSHPWLWMALWCPMLDTAISFSEGQCFCSVNTGQHRESCCL
jgi:hypothetical protein